MDINRSIVIVDKPKGPTSHEVSAKVRDIFGLKKAAHTGTLDPGVTGVLVILLGESVKLQRLFAKQKKEYICLMHLHENVPEEKVKKVIESFKGVIKQTPPVKSAVSRKERSRKIYDIELLEKKDKDVLYRAEVEAGTYIRTLCVQIGKKLGIKAHMTELRRIKSGIYTEDDAVNLIELKDTYEFYKENKKNSLEKYLVPIEEAFKDFIKITIKNQYEKEIRNGSPIKDYHIKTKESFEEGELILVENENKKIIALAKGTNNKKIIAKLERIIN